MMSVPSMLSSLDLSQLFHQMITNVNPVHLVGPQNISGLPPVPPSEQFQCDFVNCAFETHLIENLALHRWMFHRIQLPFWMAAFTCGDCCYFTPDNWNMKVHKNVHTSGEEKKRKWEENNTTGRTGRRPPICGTCGFVACSSGYLPAHQWLAHNVPLPANKAGKTCGVCAYVAYSKSDLEKHGNIHRVSKLGKPINASDVNSLTAQPAFQPPALPLPLLPPPTAAYSSSSQNKNNASDVSLLTAQPAFQPLAFPLPLLPPPNAATSSSSLNKNNASDVSLLTAQPAFQPPALPLPLLPPPTAANSSSSQNKNNASNVSLLTAQPAFQPLAFPLPLLPPPNAATSSSSQNKKFDFRSMSYFE